MFYGHLVHLVVIWYIPIFPLPRKIWQPRRKTVSTGTDVEILKIFSPKKLTKQLAFLLKTKLNYAKIGS
jgi:hypothetical protein